MNLNVSRNAISGKVPNELRNVTSLKSISLEKNLMQGDLDMIDGLMNLGMC